MITVLPIHCFSIIQLLLAILIICIQIIIMEVMEPQKYKATKSKKVIYLTTRIVQIWYVNSNMDIM